MTDDVSNVFREMRRKMKADWDDRVAEFPYWYSFFTDGIEDDWEWIDKVVNPWLDANTVKDDWTGSSDPAGFVYTVMFKDKELFDRFHAACIVGCPSYLKTKR